VAKQAETGLAAALRRWMTERKIGQKRLALLAGVNETYVRDILIGKSTNPHASKLSKVAGALGTDAATLLRAAAPPETGELVSEPRERLLLLAFRDMNEEERAEVINFINFRLSQAGRPRLGTM
jgi:transcriptional regulator with XRE-family HTH domain